MAEFDQVPELRPEQVRAMKEWRLDHFKTRTLPLCALGAVAGLVVVNPRLRPRYFGFMAGAGIVFQVVAGSSYVRSNFVSKYGNNNNYGDENSNSNYNNTVPSRLPELNSDEFTNDFESRDSNSQPTKSYEQLRIKNHGEFWGKQRTNIDRLEKVSPEQIPSINQPAPGLPKNSYGDEGFSQS